MMKFLFCDKFLSFVFIVNFGVNLNKNIYLVIYVLFVIKIKFSKIILRLEIFWVDFEEFGFFVVELEFVCFV